MSIDPDPGMASLPEGHLQGVSDTRRAEDQTVTYAGTSGEVLASGSVPHCGAHAALQLRAPQVESVADVVTAVVDSVRGIPGLTTTATDAGIVAHFSEAPISEVCSPLPASPPSQSPQPFCPTTHTRSPCCLHDHAAMKLVRVHAMASSEAVVVVI